MRKHSIACGFLAGVLAMLLFGMTACTSGSEEVAEVTNHAYISSVKLGTVKRIVMVTDTLGQLVPSTTTFTASDVLMSIDQRNRVIENRDSLLYGSDVSRVLLTIIFSGSYVQYREAENDTAEWAVYSTKDSIDLTKPQLLRVKAENLQSDTYYTLKVNVHQQDGDLMQWNHTEVDEQFFGTMTEMQAVTLAGAPLVLGTVEGGVECAKPDTEGTWTKQATNLPTTADIGTLRQFDGKAYLSTTDGAVFGSTDGVQWTQLGQPVAGLQLVAVADGRLYSLVGNTLRRADLQASSWETTEGMDDEDAQNLPQRVEASLTYTQENGTKRIVLVGENLEVNDTVCVVWSKSWSNDKKQDSTPWMYYNQGGDYTTLPCPRLHDLCLINYDGKLMALGGAPKKGHTNREALDYFYTSKDNGLTWRQEMTLRLPAELKGSTTPVAATVDDEHNIWIITGNNVWRGRLNRLAFVRP